MATVLNNTRYIIFLVSFFLFFLTSANAQQNQLQIVPFQSSTSDFSTSIHHYGPVNNNEGLWDIAEKLRTEMQASAVNPEKVIITTPQMAVALFTINSEAFISSNMNGLLIGSVLKIPDMEQLKKLDSTEALTLFLQHWDSWQEIDVTIDEKESEASVLNTGPKKAVDILEKKIEKSIKKLTTRDNTHKPSSHTQQNKTHMAKIELAPLSETPPPALLENKVFPTWCF